MNIQGCSGANIIQERDDESVQENSGEEQTLLVVGNAWIEDNSAIEILNKKKKRWIRQRDFNFDSVFFSSVVIEQILYMIGGESRDGATVKNDVYACKFLEKDKKCYKLSGMLQPRTWFTATVIDKRIYVCGGITAKENITTNTVEMYDPKSDQWFPKTSMNYSKYDHTSIAWKNKLFVFGGVNGVHLKVVEIYNTENDEWEEGSPMHVALQNCAVAVLKNQIYVMGGFDGISLCNTVYIYNVIDDKWTKDLFDLPIYCDRASAVTMNGRIYLSGGGRQFGEHIEYASNEVYEYDVDSNWSHHSSLLEKRRSHSLH